mgnify:CR=1 FL=1
MILLLDTHIWFWWVNAEHQRLTPNILKLLSESDRVVIASVSCFEIALATEKCKIGLPCSIRDWFAEALEKSGIELIHLTPAIAEKAVNLTPVHKDPFDRIILATAIEIDARLLSLDTNFPRYPEIKNHLIV